MALVLLLDQRWAMSCGGRFCAGSPNSTRVPVSPPTLPQRTIPVAVVRGRYALPSPDDLTENAPSSAVTDSSRPVRRWAVATFGRAAVGGHAGRHRQWTTVVTTAATTATDGGGQHAGVADRIDGDAGPYSRGGLDRDPQLIIAEHADHRTGHVPGIEKRQGGPTGQIRW